VIDAVEEAFDIEVHNPVVTPASPTCRPDCIDGRAPWPITIRIIVEQRLQQWFQISASNLLSNAVSDRGYS